MKKTPRQDNFERAWRELEKDIEGWERGQKRIYFLLKGRQMWTCVSTTLLAWGHCFFRKRVFLILIKREKTARVCSVSLTIKIKRGENRESVLTLLWSCISGSRMEKARRKSKGKRLLPNPSWELALANRRQVICQSQSSGGRESRRTRGLEIPFLFFLFGLPTICLQKSKNGVSYNSFENKRRKKNIQSFYLLLRVFPFFALVSISIALFSLHTIFFSCTGVSSHCWLFSSACLTFYLLMSSIFSSYLVLLPLSCSKTLLTSLYQPVSKALSISSNFSAASALSRLYFSRRYMTQQVSDIQMTGQCCDPLWQWVQWL